MPLDLFRTAHVLHLKDNVGTNLARYAEPKSWADRKPGTDRIVFKAALEPAVPLTLELPAGGDLKDFENAKIVHRAFPNLTPLQARDRRLWTRLTHVECWGYMRKRWDVPGQTGDDAKRQRYVLARYFVPQSQSRALLRNGIARLWWYAHLTHDAGRADPYELTAALLSSLDIAQQVLERNMGRAQPVRTGFLDFLRENPGRLGSSSGQKRESVRRLAKALNLRGGVTLLDCLDAQEVMAVLDGELRLSQSV